MSELQNALAKILTTKNTRVAFYIACGLWLSYSIINTSYIYNLVYENISITSDVIYYYIVLIVSLCEIGVIVREGYTVKDVYGLIILFIMSLSSILNSFPLVLYSALLVFCARKFDVRKTITICSIIVAIDVFIIISCASFGIIHDTILGDYALLGSVSNRHCLGFLYSLFPAQYLFCLTCTICYLRNKSITIVEGFILIIANLLMYRLTRSRLSFIMSCILVSSIFIMKNHWISCKLFPRIRKILVCSFPLAFVVSICVTLLYGILHPYGIDVLEGINVVLGDRLALGYEGLKSIGIKILGQNVVWQGAGLDMNGYNSHSIPYNYVDNFFLHVLLEEGFVYLLGIVILLTMVSKRAYDEGDNVLLLALFITAIHLMIDDLGMYVHYNLFYFLIAGIYFGDGHNRVSKDMPPDRSYWI